METCSKRMIFAEEGKSCSDFISAYDNDGYKAGFGL